MDANEVKPPLYMCVYVPEFPAQALLRLRPELTNSPVAVLAGESPFERVCSINANARKLGVAAGMTRSELECFTTLCVLRRSEQEEQNARSVLLEAAGAFTPRIEVQSSLAYTFMFVLDMTGTTRIFGSPQQAARRMTTTTSSLRFYTQLATSANLHAATCVAPSARKGSVFLPWGQEAEYLRLLPLSMLNLTPKQTETFELWGLHTLGELADLPEIELVVRLGQEGKHLRLQARGEYPHFFVPKKPDFLLEDSIVLDGPVELAESLLFVLSLLLDQLLIRAQTRALALASVSVKLFLSDGRVHLLTISPALPVVRLDILIKLIDLDLQSHPPSAGVTGIYVHAKPGQCSKVQFGLFAAQVPEPLRLDVSLARIAAIVGEERVGRPKLQDTHRRNSFSMGRFRIDASGAKERCNTTATVSLRRCSPPVILTVQQEERRLAAFSLSGKRYVVTKAFGPWRCSGDWWSTGIWSYEEWDVKAAANADDTLLCLLTHDLLRHHWQLDALYD